MEVHPTASTLPDWANLTPPLLQAILWSALEEPRCFHLPFFLSNRTKEAAAAQQEHAALSRLACVCRRWRAAVATAVAARAAWAVAVQRCSLASELLQIERLRVASLDLRLLTWSEVGGGAACEALLTSAAFRRRSCHSLTAVAGIPERLAPQLEAFPNLESVGLAEDYESTAFGVAGGKSHLAPMQLAPLLQLPCLSKLLLELGVVDMAQLPPQVSELTLVEVDRIVLPPAPGTSVVDRFIAVAEAAGLSSLLLESASGCLVFEEAGKAPLELELSHAARLLAAHSSRWSVQLGLHADEAIRQVLPQLQLRRLPEAPGCRQDMPQPALPLLSS